MPVMTTRMTTGAIRDKNNKVRNLRPDESLQINGPVLEATLTASDAQQEALIEQEKQVKSITGRVMFDTGASFSCFDISAAQEIGLAIVGRGRMASASHAGIQVPVYAGKLILPKLNINIQPAMGANIASQGIIALIGRDVMRHGAFYYSGIDGSFSFAV